MSQHYDNPLAVTYNLSFLANTLATRHFSPPEGKTRGRLVGFTVAVHVAVAATSSDPSIRIGVAGATTREGQISIPNGQGANTSLSGTIHETSATQGFGFGQGNPNDPTVEATAEDVIITGAAGTGGIVAGQYDAVITIEWY